MPGMERPRPRSLVTRLKRAALFVAIVWALAASFVAFEQLPLSFVAANPEQFGDLLLSQATQQSTVCKVDPGEAAGQAGSLTAAEARADAWMLGVYFGSDTQSRKASRDRTQAESDSEVERLAERLAVPAPGPFAARQFANTHDEFVEHVEADAAGTGHRIAVKYAPEACEIFKLGAFWGYSMWIRVSLPGTRTVMAVPINYYGRQVGLPEALTTAMITPASADGSSADRAAEAIALTEAVTKHLAAAP